MNFLHERKLSQSASDLIQFDSDSIRQVVSAEHGAMPDVWLVDPDAYEKTGRVLRDSESPRMLAYSTQDHTLYLTDGCNSCSRRVRLSSNELPDVRPELVEKLAALIKTKTA
jgi:hypothetical protein